MDSNQAAQSNSNSQGLWGYISSSISSLYNRALGTQNEQRPLPIGQDQLTLASSEQQSLWDHIPSYASMSQRFWGTEEKDNDLLHDDHSITIQAEPVESTSESRACPNFCMDPCRNIRSFFSESYRRWSLENQRRSIENWKRACQLGTAFCTSASVGVFVSWFSSVIISIFTENEDWQLGGGFSVGFLLTCYLTFVLHKRETWRMFADIGMLPISEAEMHRQFEMGMQRAVIRSAIHEAEQRQRFSDTLNTPIAR
jgi:hypothetical protein